MVNRKNISKGSALQTELDREIARFVIAEDIIDRIDNLLAAAPELFETDAYHAFGKVYNGDDIRIAVRSVVDNNESITGFYAIEDGGIAFTAERLRGDDNAVSSVFIASGRWTEKFEALENRVRERVS